MKNAKQCNLVTTFLALLMGGFMLIVSCIGCLSPIRANAESDIAYSDSLYGDPVGTITTVAYDIEYDSYEITERVAYDNAPTYANRFESFKNYCGPITGMNMVAFYDRWFTNLIPSFDPGMSFSNGSYLYFPDQGKPQTESAYSDLYYLMKTDTVGGTTSANFRNGLESFVESAGYSCSFSSFYSNEDTVNFNALKNAIDQNKVGVIMCSEYNYVLQYGDNAAESKMQVVKNNSTIPHMMMVYGYKTYKYYRDGVNFQTDTLLYVTRSNGLSQLGYMIVNDFQKIDEAWIATIS